MSQSQQKLIAITGPTGGIGKATAEELARKGYRLALFARNQEKLKELSKQLLSLGSPEVEHFTCDLADLKSVRRAAQEFRGKFDRLDVLINNAGGIIPKLRYSADDTEYSFAMNHLGHFYLANLLKDSLAESDDPRMISVSSVAHIMGKLDFSDLAKRKGSYSAFKVYADAKLCNIYFTREAARRWADFGLKAYCLHPGVVRTGFGSEYSGIMGLLIKLGAVFMISPDKGTETSVFLATTDKDHKNGSYFIRKKKARTSKIAQDMSIASQLWKFSEELLEKTDVRKKRLSS